MPGAVKMMFSHRRGCKNHVFNGTCFFEFLGVISGVVGIQNLHKIAEDVPLEGPGAPALASPPGFDLRPASGAAFDSVVVAPSRGAARSPFGSGADAPAGAAASASSRCAR